MKTLYFIWTNYIIFWIFGLIVFYFYNAVQIPKNSINSINGRWFNFRIFWALIALHVFYVANLNILFYICVIRLNYLSIIGIYYFGAHHKRQMAGDLVFDKREERDNSILASERYLRLLGTPCTKERKALLKYHKTSIFKSMVIGCRIWLRRYLPYRKAKLRVIRRIRKKVGRITRRRWVRKIDKLILKILFSKRKIQQDIKLKFLDFKNIPAISKILHFLCKLEFRFITTFERYLKWYRHIRGRKHQHWD